MNSRIEITVGQTTVRLSKDEPFPMLSIAGRLGNAYVPLAAEELSALAGAFEEAAQTAWKSFSEARITP